MNKTLLILKPDTVQKGNVGNVLAMIESAGFRIRRLEMVQLTPERARGFYAVHEGKPFLDDLVAYMTSGPVIPVVLEGDANVISKARDLMGATDSSKAAPDTIRGRYGVDIGTNAVHGSDSPESASTEIPFFFPDEPVA